MVSWGWALAVGEHQQGLLFFGESHMGALKVHYARQAHIGDLRLRRPERSRQSAKNLSAFRT